MAFSHKIEKSKMINPMSDSNAHLRDELSEVSHEKYVPQEEITATRWVEIDNHKWKIERKNPYGSWTVVPPKGFSLPIQLSGKYTSALDLQRAIEKYVNVHILEPELKNPQKSKARRRKTEMPAVESVEMID